MLENTSGSVKVVVKLQLLINENENDSFYKYRGKFSSGKMTKFSLSDENFPRRKIFPDENFPRRKIFPDEKFSPTKTFSNNLKKAEITKQESKGGV